MRTFVDFMRSIVVSPLRCWLRPACFALALSPVPATAEIDLDEVTCALCHYEQGEAFGQSIHFNSGLLLCSDCHGGLPFEADNELAKAPGTGFVGRPQRQDIARVCGTCHVASVRFFAQGPHADWHDSGNPTCVTCHGNHDVQAAELAMMDTTCVPCHHEGSPEMATGLVIRRELHEAAGQLVATSTIVDSLAAIDRSLRRAQPFVASALSALTDARAGTHALSREATEQSLTTFTGELEAAQVLVEERRVAGEQRQLAVVSIWLFIAVNILILWTKRRQLD